MKQPSRLRINGRSYSIVALPDDSPHLGETLRDEAKIALRGGQVLSSLQDTLLHEVMHAVRHQQGYEDGGKVEEGYVRSLATGVLGVLHDNPTFAKWLLIK